MANPPQTAFESPLVVASNRGPVAFHRNDDGEIVAERGTGGLVTALAGVLFESDATWLAAPMSEVDREVADSGKTLEVNRPDAPRSSTWTRPTTRATTTGSPTACSGSCTITCSTSPTCPRGTPRRGTSGTTTAEVNRAFAQRLATQDDRDPVYLVQDYQLALVPRMLRETRRTPGSPISHTRRSRDPPTCGSCRRGCAEELLRGMLGADVLGFQAERWAENFLLCVRETLAASAWTCAGRRVEIDGRHVLVRTYPVALDPGPFADRCHPGGQGPAQGARRPGAVTPAAPARGPDGAVEEHRARVPGLRDLLDGEPGVARARAVPLAAAALAAQISRVPRLRGALLGGRRRDQRATRRAKDGSRSRCAPRRTTRARSPPTGCYDALLVNPIFDGMNLVAMEGPLVNRRHGALILSRERGRVRAARAARDRREPLRRRGDRRRRSRAALEMPAGGAHAARAWARARRCSPATRSDG